LDERDRLARRAHPRVETDDWSVVLSGYLGSDMLTAGMPPKVYHRFFSSKVDPLDKWPLLAPYWPAIKNTGYGQAVCLSLKALYDVDELSAKTVKQVQAGYEKVRRPGFYKHILSELGRIESCQVNYSGRPRGCFHESEMPTFLMQDISMLEMIRGPQLKRVSEPAGIAVACLSDWHRAIDWWFDKYGRYAVAVKSQHAYSRDIDHAMVPAEQVEGVFKRILAKQKVSAGERKALEDHLFWYAVGKATEHQLPVKLHTGYYAGQNTMPLSRLINNPGSATELCRTAPETTFVFMHICYPYYEEILAAVKHYTNAHVDMCWAWIMNPVASKDFLKKYLVTAPANKILTFGGDYIQVEPVLGHAIITRRGIALALSELVEEGWLSMGHALELIDPIMHGNARRIFRLAEKTKVLANAPWA
jgi:predicted TIM-barrel fold metal-dependent hydrolase